MSYTNLPTIKVNYLTLDGDQYEQTLISANNTAYGGTGGYSINMGWNDIGDGFVSPYTTINNSIDANVRAFCDITRLADVAGQKNLHLSLDNQLDNNRYALIDSYYDSTTNRMTVRLSASNNGSGGTFTAVGLTAGFGAYLSGNLSLLDRTSPNSIAVKSDITDNGVGIVASGSFGVVHYIKYAPDLTGKAWIKQWGIISVSAGITSTDALAITYTNLAECIINVTVANSTISSGVSCCGNFYDDDEINLFCTQSQDLYFETWGY